MPNYKKIGKILMNTKPTCLNQFTYQVCILAGSFHPLVQDQVHHEAVHRQGALAEKTSATEGTERS